MLQLSRLHALARAGRPTQAASFKTSSEGEGEEASAVQHGDFNKLLVAIQPRWVLHSSHRCFTTALMQVSVHEDERVNLTQKIECFIAFLKGKRPQ